MAMRCDDGVYLKVKQAPVIGDGDCQPDSRLAHNGCATVVTYGPVSILSDGTIRVTTGENTVDILLDCGQDFKIQADQDIILHPGQDRRVKIYGDLWVYGEMLTKSEGEIPEKDDPLE